eukprot:1179144-Prorocentrum_minimum.AAC.3
MGAAGLPDTDYPGEEEHAKLMQKLRQRRQQREARGTGGNASAMPSGSEETAAVAETTTWQQCKVRSSKTITKK